MVTAALSFIPNCTSPSGVFAADIFAMLSVFARADIAPAITYIVSMVFSSKNARSDIASSFGLKISVSLFVRAVNGPVKNLSRVTTPFTGTPGFESFISALNFSGDEKFILQLHPALPSVILQPFLSK